jgi:hypothetical protein
MLWHKLVYCLCIRKHILCASFMVMCRLVQELISLEEANGLVCLCGHAVSLGFPYAISTIGKNNIIVN